MANLGTGGEGQGAGIGAVADRLLAPVAVIAADSTLLYVNVAAASSIGREPAWLIGRRMIDLVHPDDRPRLERELRRVAAGRAGGTTTYRLRADATRAWRVFEAIADNLLDDPDVAGILLSSRDITDQLAHEDELYQAAYCDSLTGLPNRAKIRQDLDGLMSASKPLAVAFLGLDRFKMINDSLGHTAGDAVLEAVAARLTSVLPASTTVGSFGGDVFVILIRGAASADARTLLWRVVQRLSEPLFIAGHELRLSSSAGIAGRDAAATAESLLRDAGLAMHRAKAAGGGQVELFEAGMREDAVTRLELEASLRGAITRSELSLALQPVVRLDDATPVGAEALVRWHRETDTVEPARFVAIAEESGLIITLGEWILDHAARAARRAPAGHVVVNLSARQLASPGLPDRIARVLAAHRLPPSSLGFEITETLVVQRFDYVVSVLHAIRNLGCRVGLDDFGTGYSSLGYLRRLPIDFLKIDGSLTADVDTDCQARAIAGAIITMADALGLEVVAEGVETEAQATELRGLGCHLAQGYLFGRPTEI